MPDYDEGDHLVKNAAEMVAAMHVADGHVTSTDHAEQLAHLCTLQIMRKLAQSIQSICTAAAVSTRTVHFGAVQCSFSEQEWPIRLGIEMQGRVRVGLVTRRGSATTTVGKEKRSSFLRETGHVEDPIPVRACLRIWATVFIRGFIVSCGVYRDIVAYVTALKP